MIYVRWKKGESRRERAFEPLAGRDPVLALLPCPLCGSQIGDESRHQLIAMGPDEDDEDARKKHEDGRWHTASAAVMHEACAGYLTDEGLEWLVSQLTRMEIPDPQ